MIMQTVCIACIAAFLLRVFPVNWTPNVFLARLSWNW